MPKNSIGSNFTGSGSKRPKKYYSDKDAGKSYFKPDHSEFYPGSKGNEIDYPFLDGSEYDTKLSNEESSRPEIELHERNGATSIRVKSEQEIADELNPRKVINRGSLDKHHKQQKKELVDVMLDNDSNDYDLLPHRGSMQSTNKVEFYDPKRPHPVRRMKRSDSAKNSKTNNNYRPRQEFQQVGGYNTINQTIEEYNLMEDARFEADDTKSQLEEILETKPHIVWSRKDEKRLNREKHKNAA